MPLPEILSAPPGDDGLRTWAFNHWSDHQEIAQAIQTQRGVPMTVYDLIDIKLSDPRRWLELHQQAHNDINAVLGSETPDLTAADFRDENVMRGWYYDNWQAHNAARTILNI